MIRRVVFAPDQNGHSAGNSEAVVDIARTNHLAVFDIDTKLYTLDVILEYSLFSTAKKLYSLDVILDYRKARIREEKFSTERTTRCKTARF